MSIDTRDFYVVRAPSEWAGAPERYSHSALSRIGGCPLRFQLERSQFPKIGRFPARPSPAGVEGSIVHDCLEELFKAFSLSGFPELGSSEAMECSRQVRLGERISKQIAEHEEKLERHPRGNSCRIRTSAQQMGNQVVRLFREQYSEIEPDQQARVPTFSPPGGSTGAAQLNPKALLEQVGVLSEIWLEHPEMSFGGCLDLVFRRDGQVVIADFKTGVEKDEHLDQVLRYALLWWRVTGDMPEIVEIRYFENCRTLPVTKELLLETESRLEAEIAEASSILSHTPAAAQPGDHCRFCDVRQFCNNYWKEDGVVVADHGSRFDLELRLEETPSSNGFLASSKGGKSYQITCAPEIARLSLSGMKKPDEIRVTGAVRVPSADEVRLLPSSEIWRMPEGDEK